VYLKGGKTVRNKILILSVTLLLVLSFGSLAPAQEAPPNVIIVYFFKANPGMAQQFEAALRAHLEWNVENEGQWPWNTWQIMSGDRYGEYVVTSAFHSWEDFDANEEYFSRQVANFRLNAAPLLESVECIIDEADLINATFPPDFSYINVVEFYTYHIKPCHMAEFNEARIRIHQATAEADWPVYYYWETLRSGGTVPCAYLIIFHRNWAELREPEISLWQVLVDAYGEEEASSLVDSIYNSVHRIECSVMKYRPDLSYNNGQIGWRSGM